MPKVSIAEAKSHLSELIAKGAHGRERFVITRSNRSVAALVSLDDLRGIGQHQGRQELSRHRDTAMASLPRRPCGAAWSN